MYVLEGVAANLLLGTLFVWSVLRNPLLELYPSWNEGMLSFVFGIHNLFTCAGILLGGRLCSRFPARNVFMLFAVLVTVGLGGFAFLPTAYPTLSYVMVFILFCCFAATGIGVGIHVVQSTTIPRFPDHSGAISGTLYMALGVSSVLLAFLAQKLLPVIGVRFVMPVFATIVLGVSLLILADKQSMRPPESREGSRDGQEGVSPGQMLKSGAFWVLVIWNVCLRTAGLTLLDHAASMAAAFGGFALTAMLIAPANGLGCMAVGAALDKLGMKRVMRTEAVLMIGAAALLCLGVFRGVYPLIFAGLLLGGFAYGGSSSSYAAAVKNQFGARFYTQNFAVSNLAMGCAALLEATSGTFLDISGTYLSVTLMVLALAGAALAASVFAGKAKIRA
ncbi:MAG: MFS transporter [Oscillospiraceae bacterium]